MCAFVCDCVSVCEGDVNGVTSLRNFQLLALRKMLVWTRTAATKVVGICRYCCCFTFRFFLVTIFFFFLRLLQWICLDYGWQPAMPTADKDNCQALACERCHLLAKGYVLAYMRMGIKWLNFFYDFNGKHAVLDIKEHKHLNSFHSQNGSFKGVKFISLQIKIFLQILFGN